MILIIDTRTLKQIGPSYPNQESARQTLNRWEQQKVIQTEHFEIVDEAEWERRKGREVLEHDDNLRKPRNGTGNAD